MTWLKVDDGFFEHPKVRGLSFQAVGLWTITASFAARFGTDGTLSREDLDYIMRARRQTRAFPKLAAELVAAGLWEKDGRNGYRIHDFTEWNPTRAEVKALRRMRRDAGRLGGLTRAARAAEITPRHPPSTPEPGPTPLKQVLKQMLEDDG